MRCISHILALVILFAPGCGFRPVQPVEDPHAAEHGPDTDYARDGFAERLGLDATVGVTNVYFHNPPGFLDATYRIRFGCLDNSVVERIIEDKQLQLSPTPRDGLHSSAITNWWKPYDHEKNMKNWFREGTNRYYWFLWHDVTNAVVYYEEFST